MNPACLRGRRLLYPLTDARNDDAGTGADGATLLAGNYASCHAASYLNNPGNACSTYDGNDPGTAIATAPSTGTASRSTE